MKQIIQYQCEICRKRYDTQKDALDCESQGSFDKYKYPIGLMFEYHHHDFVGIFAIAEIDNDIADHYGRYGSWACRTARYPSDSLGTQMCGGGNNYIRSNEQGIKDFIKVHNITAEKTKCDEFKRMINYLKSQKIQPRYYTPAGKLITLH